MKRILLGIAATIVAGAASALHPSSPMASVIVENTPLPVTVQNTPIPVSITDGATTAINTSRMVNERLVQPPNGVPSVAVADVFSNQSSTTAQVYAYVSSASNASFPCGGDPRPTSVEVLIFPIGEPAVTGLQVPTIEYLSVRKGGADYCGAAVSMGPLFIPPGNQLDFNVVYSTLPSSLAPVKFYVNVNGFYKK
jgi:hypothetical protein